jgi:succinate-semialdehyde dehydrogenase/glutarate-semialdehyde dehydrogenase
MLFRICRTVHIFLPPYVSLSWSVSMAEAQYSPLQLLIDGQWLSGGGRESEPVINPATGETLAMLPHASKADLDAALEAAHKAFKTWRNVSANERSRMLRTAATTMRERVNQIATVLTLEEGKTLAEAKGEVHAAAEIFEWAAEESRRAYGRVVPSRAVGMRQLVIKEPVGPVAAFAPWNFPAVTPARKIAAAIAAGCSIIIKPSEETPATTLEMARALMDAGLPAGVLNVVFGVPSNVSTHLIGSSIIRKMSFTGSTVVGKQLTAMAANTMKRVTMELGGHAPVLVFDDADVDVAAKQLVAGKFRNSGQVCVSPTRFFVQENAYGKFVQRFTELTQALSVGNGMDANTKMGPLANPRRLDAMDKFVSDAKKNGAKITAGGDAVGGKGFFWKPTVMTDVPKNAKIMNDEPFGPLAPIVPFKTFDEVIEQANRLPYGLASYAFTGSSKTATAVSDALETGMVGVNTLMISLPETPFGGVKDSGYGSEGGTEGLDAYLSTKLVALS